MKLQHLLAALLLAACSALPQRSVTVVEAPPLVAASAAWLVASLDISLPVVVEDGPLLERGLYGYTQFYPDHYLVILDYRLEPHARGMVLVHELAHVLARERGSFDLGHGVDWGVAYAEVFRLWVSEE